MIQYKTAIAPASDGVKFGSTAKVRACYRHETDRSYSDNENGIAVLNVCEFGSVEARRDHIRKHRSVLHFDAVRQVSEVSVRIVYMKEFAEYAVFKVGKFPTGEHAARMHRITCLRFEGVPVGRDRGNQNLVARFEIFDQCADFDDFAAAFVT